MTTTVVRPPSVSLCDLVLHGLLDEDDVLPGGKVAEDVRALAESRYMLDSPPSATTTTPRSVGMYGRLVGGSVQTRPPRVPARRSPQMTARAHIARPRDTPRDTPRDRPLTTPRDTPRDSPRDRPLTTPRDTPRDRPHHRPTTSGYDAEVRQVPPIFLQSLGDKVCCICRDREKTHAPYPCFHMCMCEGCSEQVETCPLCRCPVGSVHRIFT